MKALRTAGLSQHFPPPQRVATRHATFRLASFITGGVLALGLAAARPGVAFDAASFAPSINISLPGGAVNVAVGAVAAQSPTASTTLAGKLRFAGWQLDTAARRLTNPHGVEVALTGGEFDLLRAFAQHAGRVLSRDFLLEQTRGREAGPFDRTIDVQVGRLRRKLEHDNQEPQFIKSVRGAGYILTPLVETA